jgi:penicillin-binding protein 1A
MPETPNHSPRSDETGTGGSAPRGASFGAGESRTLAAGRAFLEALGGDLAALARRLGRALRTAGQRKTQASPAIHAIGRACGDFGRAIALFAKRVIPVAVLGSLTLAGAMLWALHDLPAEKPIGGSSESSLLLEAANGEALGRVGPLKMAEAARTDFPENLVAAVISIEDRRFYSHWASTPRESSGRCAGTSPPGRSSRAAARSPSSS